MYPLSDITFIFSDTILWSRLFLCQILSWLIASFRFLLFYDFHFLARFSLTFDYSPFRLNFFLKLIKVKLRTFKKIHIFALLKHYSLVLRKGANKIVFEFIREKSEQSQQRNQ